MLAIGQRGAGLAPAEMELGLARIADRPAAHRFLQRHDAGAFIERDNQLLERRRRIVRLRLVMRLERGRAARAKQKRRTAACARHMRASRPWARRARARGPARQAKTMHLADHGIARNPAQAGGNLARAQPLGPKFFQQFNPLVSPSHGGLLELDSESPRLPRDGVLKTRNYW